MVVLTALERIRLKKEDMMVNTSPPCEHACEEAPLLRPAFASTKRSTATCPGQSSEVAHDFPVKGGETVVIDNGREGGAFGHQKPRAE